MGISRRVIGAIALTAAVAAVTGAAVASGPASDQRAAKFEQKFLAETIDHHFGALKMGKVCGRKAESRKLEKVCGEIVEAQGVEIDQMQRWLLKWYDEEKTPELDRRMRADIRELRETERGEEFDVMVSEMFIEHHEQQIRRSERCLEKAEHKKLIAMCEEQIEVQGAEIKVFEKVIASYE